jgi:alpha-N-acetylglucosamine transferase
LGKLGCEFRETLPVDLSHKKKDFANPYPYYDNTWTKIKVFGLVEFERVVLLDADMLVRQNVDELMNMDIPEGWIAATHNCVCNPKKKPNYPPNW